VSKCESAQQRFAGFRNGVADGVKIDKMRKEKIKSFSQPKIQRKDDL
jgi:hypothetical protein